MQQQRPIILESGMRRFPVPITLAMLMALLELGPEQREKTLEEKVADGTLSHLDRQAFDGVIKTIVGRTL